jgi:hypothetical protein
MKFAAALAAAAAKDALFLAGSLTGSFLAGAEQALDWRARRQQPSIEYVPGVGYKRNN